MVINRNLNAINAHRNISLLNVSRGKSMEKLNSGLRINRAGDDAAGFTISEKMRSQIRGLNQASRNAQDGISMIQTAEGALSETQAIAQRMRELSVQSANGTYTDEDRELINQEFSKLIHEIDRIAINTEFGGKAVLDGSLSGVKINGQNFKDLIKPGGMNGNLDHIDATPQELAKLGRGEFVFSVSSDDYINQPPKYVTISLIDNTFDEPYVMDSVEIENLKDGESMNLEIADITIKIKGGLTQFADGIIINNTPEFEGNGVELQVGANQNQIIGFSIDNMKARELELRGLNILTRENSQKSISVLDNAINKISIQRSNLGSVQNRLEHSISLIDNTSENIQASESRIRDVDMAKEMMNLTKLNVLQQASQAMLSQANQAPQQVLQILR